MDKILYIFLLTYFLISTQEFDGFSIIKTKENVTIDYIDVTRDILYPQKTSKKITSFS